jgi:hypothetical protein
MLSDKSEAGKAVQGNDCRCCNNMFQLAFKCNYDEMTSDEHGCAYNMLIKMHTFVIFISQSILIFHVPFVTTRYERWS